MSTTPRDTALQALSHMRGDDLYRARAAFKNCTAAQMDEQYGQSGKTRAQIIAEYVLWEAKVDAAVEWVKAAK